MVPASPTEQWQPDGIPACLKPVGKSAHIYSIYSGRNPNKQLLSSKLALPSIGATRSIWLLSIETTGVEAGMYYECNKHTQFQGLNMKEKECKISC